GACARILISDSCAFSQFAPDTGTGQETPWWRPTAALFMMTSTGAFDKRVYHLGRRSTRGAPGRRDRVGAHPGHHGDLRPPGPRSAGGAGPGDPARCHGAGDPARVGPAARPGAVAALRRRPRTLHPQRPRLLGWPDDPRGTRRSGVNPGVHSPRIGRRPEAM